MLGLTLFGAGFGAWMTSRVGIGLPIGRLQAFESAVEAVQLPMIIDAPRDRVQAMDDLVRQHHPQAELEGIEPDMPLFP